jgi:hypothetical protein
LTRSPFIQYLDADDALAPNTLEARVLALEYSGASVAYCDWQRLEQQSDGGFLPACVCAQRLGTHPDIDILRGAWWPPGALLYRRELVRILRPWSEELNVSQDFWYLLTAASAGALFAPVNHIGLQYRVGMNSLCHRNAREFLDETYSVVCQVHDEWGKRNLLTREHREALSGVYQYFARVFESNERMAQHVQARLVSLKD